MNWNYLAGFFDGEGWVNIQRKGKQLMVQLGMSNTDQEVMEEIAEFLKTDLVRRGPNKTYFSKKDIYVLKICDHKEVREVALQLLPKCITKRKRLQHLLDAIEIHSWFRERMDERAEYVRNLYWTKEMSSPEIARIIGLDSSSLTEFMKRHNIPRRSCSEALKLTWKRREKKIVDYAQWGSNVVQQAKELIESRTGKLEAVR